MNINKANSNWPVDPGRMERGLYWQDGITVVAGCSHVSAGCKNCWAAGMEQRFQKRGLITSSGKWTGEIKTQEHLLKRCETKKPKVIAFWNDLFHKDVPDTFYEKLVTVIADNRQHVYLMLTKRPENIPRCMDELSNMSNVFLGVTVENMAFLGRIAMLTSKWHGRKMLSVEPLLEPIEFEPVHLRSIDWAVVGAESGPNKRPCNINWIDSIVDDCMACDVLIFVKQLHIRNRLSKDISEWPDSLRYREVPKVIKNDQPILNSVS